MAVKKKKSFTWLFVLLAIVLILMGILHYIETKGLKESVQNSPAINTPATDPDSRKRQNVTDITIRNPKEDKCLHLKKDSDGLWYVESEGTMYLAEQQIVGQLISEMAGFETEYPVAQGADEFEHYMVDEAHALRVTALENGTTLFDLLIGRYDPQSKGGETYVRWYGEDGIYSVLSFLRVSFQSDISHYRNKRLCNLSYRKMQSIEFRYPADSSFVITQPQPDVWLIDGAAGKEGEIEKYAGTLGFLMSGDFADENKIILPKSPRFTAVISGMEGEKFYISAYQVGQDWYLKSSYDRYALWNGNRTDLLKRAFPAKRSFF